MNKFFNSVKTFVKTRYKAILAEKRDEVIATLGGVVGFALGVIASHVGA